MRLEIIDRGMEIDRSVKAATTQAFQSAVNHFAAEIGLVRIRLAVVGRASLVRCKVRAWRRDGPTIVVSVDGATVEAAVHEAAQVLQKNIRRIKDRGASRRDRATPRRVAAPPAAGTARRGRVDAETERARPPRARPVLVVMPALMRPKTTVLRAAAFAKGMDAPLAVLGLAPSGRVDALFPQRHLPEAVATIEFESAESRRIWRWCNKILLNPLAPEDVSVTREDVRAAVADAVKATRAQLVVMPDMLLSGAKVADLADRLRVPVLVSRLRQPGKAIVASTDFINETLPVLRRSVELAKGLEVPVTFVHNVAPVRAVPTFSEGMWPLLMATERALLEARTERLQATAEAAEKKAYAKVVSEPDTVEAILQVARSKKADLIVVGHYHRSWLNRLFGAGVSARLLARAKRSVLVIPLNGEAPDEPATGAAATKGGAAR